MSAPCVFQAMRARLPYNKTMPSMKTLSSPITRRDALRGLFAAPLIGAAALSGCADPANAKTVTVRFWNGWTGPDGARALAIVRAFNAQNPDVEIHMQRIDWGTYYNKLFVAGIAGRAPELFILHTSNLRRFAEAGFLQTLDSLTQNYPTGDLDASVWKAAHIDNAAVGLPVDIHMVGAFVNQTLLQKAGFDAPPTTRDEFVQVLRKITDKKTGADKTWGFAISSPSQTALTLMWQWGGTLFSPDLTHCTLNSAENAEALQFLVDLIRTEQTVLPPEGGDPWISFRQGRVGMTWNGIYMLPDLQKQADLHFVGAPVPQIGANQAAWVSSHNFCLKADMNPRLTEAAWRFVRFYSDHSLEWAAAGQVPVRETLRETKTFRQDLPVQAQFAREIPYGRYQPQVAFAFEFQTEFDFMVERVLRGTVRPAQALTEAENKINAIIARRTREKAEA